MTDRVSRHVLPYLIAGTLFILYTAISVGRHLRIGSSGYDLGIFEQAIRAYSELRAPVAELKGPGYVLLGDHFHPILVLLAPAYRVFPSPITLLVAQAALLALSVIPVTRLAFDTIGRPAGACVGLSYGLSWGMLQAVGFDFHEICFAVPLLACSLERLARGRWRAAVAWAVPLVLVKEDLPVTLAAIGGYLLLRGRRRLGAAVAAFGISSELLIIRVVIPFFNSDHGYAYASSIGDPLALVWAPGTKLLTVALLLVPTAFLVLRSPLLLIALPTLIWRFWSTNPNHWGTTYHYSAVLVHIVFVAFIDALRSLNTGHHPPHSLPIRTAPRLALATTILIGLVHNSARLAAPSPAPAPLRPESVVAALRMIPDGASVAAANRIAPQLTSRCQVFLFPTYPDNAIRPEWVALTTAPDTSLRPAAEVTARFNELPGRGYTIITNQGGIILLRHSKSL